MASSTVPALPAASALGGTEVFYGVQSAGDVKVTATQIKTFSATSITPLVIDSANVVSQRNSTNSQTQKIYVTDDGSGNAAWTQISSTGGTTTVATTKSGTGTEQNLTLDVAPSGFSGTFKVRTGFDALVITSANAVFGVTIQTGILNVSTRYIGALQYFTPTTGGTVTVTNAGPNIIIDPAGTLATLTITLPSGIEEGTTWIIRTSKTLTSLTVNAAGGFTVVSPPTTLAAGQQLTAVYKNSNTSYYCGL